jgi:hypothetical protein
LGHEDLDSESYPLSQAEHQDFTSLWDRVEKELLGSEMRRVLFLIAPIHEGCSVFTTKENRFGFVRGHTMPGDQVCLFDGAHSFYTIREGYSTGSGEKFKFTGEAYVHKAMHGEVEALGLESYDITFV